MNDMVLEGRFNWRFVVPLVVLLFFVLCLRIIALLPVVFEEGEYVFDGCIVDEVDVRKDKVKYTVEGDFGAGMMRVLVNGSRYPVYEYGDCLRIVGVVARPGEIDGFAYDKYLARYGIFAVIYMADLEFISHGDDLFKYIYRFKGVFLSRLNNIFAEPHGSFMAGLILGSRAGIGDDLMRKFELTGLTHIVAVSGYNVTMVVLVVSAFFGFLGRKRKIIASFVFVLFFVVLVGMSAAVIRAAFMGSIGLMALYFGRDYHAKIALFTAGVLMGVWNWRIIFYDSGFELSFLATAGIIFVSPRLKRYFSAFPEIFAIRESIIMTLSAQVFALPIIIFTFGRLSLISPIANVFVLPLIPPAMLFGFFAVVFSFISSSLAGVFGFFGYLFLETIVFLVDLFAKFPFASIQIF